METEQKELITIEGKEVQRLEYKGQPVVTYAMIDELHQLKPGNAARNFRNNRQYFIEGKHFFELPYEEWSRLPPGKIYRAVPAVEGTAGRNSSRGPDTGQRNPMHFFTEYGYLMLVKSLSGDLAWRVQGQLVDVYFAARTLKTRFSALSPEERALVDANAWREIALESTRRIEEKVSAIELHLRDLARAVPDESRSELTDFFRDTLEVELGACVEKQRVYSAYRLHCATNRSTPLSKSAFMKALYDLKPRLRPTTRTIMGKKIPHIKNVKLKKGVLAPSQLTQGGEVSDE